jgi:hypothetical protein
MVPMIFALEHANYARWLSVHITDMKSLPESTKTEFQEHGHWVILKTNNRFSAIPIDQAQHEQENRNVKGSGGCIGLTDNPIAFRRWMLSGPELSRLQTQLEGDYLLDDDTENPTNLQNHEQGLSAQNNSQHRIISRGRWIVFPTPSEQWGTHSWTIFLDW